MHPDTSAISAIQNLRETLRVSLIEREPEIEAMLLGLVAREHVLLVGPPGTAKSALANGLTRAIKGADAFSVLLTKFTTPEELFGPVKLSALREDRYERAIYDYLPMAEIGFIDEIWKASSAILNTLLTLLQERTFDNGGMRVACPLRLAVAASNEWPSAEDGQELGAIFDRFLIRRVVRPVSPSNRSRLLYADLPAAEAVIGLDAIDAAAMAATTLPVSAEAKDTLAQILDELAGAGIRPGDRRSRKAVGIARAAAWLSEATEVEPGHLECLADVLWSSPEQVEQTAEIVTRIANPAGAALTDLLKEVDEVVAGSSSSTADAAAKMGAIKKLESCEKKAVKLVTEFMTPTGKVRAQDLVKFIKGERVNLTASAMGIDSEKARAILGGAA
jgi:MoxR-like ATPase